MSSFYGTDIDSQPFIFQDKQRLRFNFGLELELSHALKSNTVYLANDKQLQRQRELDEAAAAEQGVTLSGVPDSGRRIVKLAHSPEITPQQQIDNFISETNLLKHLYLAGVPVPRLIAQVAANSLLCKDSDLRIPHPALMVLDYIDGISLKEAAAAGSLLERAGKVAQLWPQLLSIVAQLQRHQVIHRDLKPDQFLVKAGQPVLLDFDKASSADYRNTTVSHSPYAAPEVQAGSEHSTSDWYSLTAISVWLMTGHDPAPTGDLHAAEVFQPFRAFWLKGMAAVPQQRFSDLNALNTGFLQALAEFKRELNPLDEAKARQQEWLERLQQHEQQIAALTEQQQSQVKNLAALVEHAHQAGVAFQQAVTALDAELQSCGHALDALVQQLKQQSTQLSVDLVDEATARAFLAQPWSDFANAIDNQRQQLASCSSAERLLMLASQISPVDFTAVIAKAAECQQQRQQLEQSLSTCTENPSQQRLLSTLSRSQQNLDRQLNLLQNNASSALRISSVADVVRQIEQHRQMTQALEILLVDYLQLTEEFKPEWFALVITNNNLLARSNVVPNIHGWGSDQVKTLQQQAALEIGKPVAFQEPLLNGNALGPKMVVIPAGSFYMGCNNEGPGGYKVTHARHFAVSQHAITFDDWSLYIAHCGSQSNKLPDDEGWGIGQRPVINVSWYDANRYAAWLSKVSGKRFRLLSESEWEYAARAGAVSCFAQFGSCIDTSQANYNGNYAMDGCPKSKTGIYLKRTQPVGQYPANGFGLYDMLGNVFEWTADSYQGSFNAIPRNGRAYVNGTCFSSVIRGGSWNETPCNLQVSVSGYRSPGSGGITVGIRLAQDF